ncbi:MAG: magnesium/cobalt transporter CorA [Bryobacteraceae bacterium]
MQVAKQPELPPGFRVGTLAVEPDHLPTRVTVLSYDSARATEQVVPVTGEAAIGTGTGGFRWIHIQGLGDLEPIRAIGLSLGLPAFVIEDLTETGQRPKSEWLDPDTIERGVLLIARAPSSGRRQESRLEQIGIAAGPGFVLTVQESHSDLLRPVWDRILLGDAKLRSMGPTRLSYEIVDRIVDRFYPALEQIGDRLEALEDRLMDAFEEGILAEVNEVRTELINLRRVSWPQREAIQRLARNEKAFFPAELEGPLRECYDHCLHVAETIDSYRELVGAINGTYLAVVGNRTNEVMRVLTIMATVFIPLTFIAGIYGMNFENMPELKMRYGYPAVWAVMLVTALGLLLYFRRKGWIRWGGGSAS